MGRDELRGLSAACFQVRPLGVIASTKAPDAPSMQIAVEQFLEEVFVPYAAELMVSELLSNREVREAALMTAAD